LTSSCVSNTVENNKSWIQYQGSYNTSSWPVENQMYAEYKYPAFYDEYPIADLYVADVVAGASNWKILLKGDLDQPYGSNSASIRNSNIFLIGTALTGGSATVPSVTTDYVTLVGSDLSLQGSITSAGGAIVSARGFVYDTTSVGTNPGNVAPALSGYLHSVYDSGFLGIGTFFKSVEDVTEGFTYFVRAYAQNSVGFSYGEEVSLLIPSLPAVTTDSVLTVGQATGSLINTGFVPVTTEGFVYSTSSVSSNPGNVSPVSSGYTDYVFSTGSFSEGTFSQKLLRILPNTRYYVRAYVQNSKGYAYGDEITVLTDVLLWKQGAFYCAESDQTTSLEFSDNVLNGDLLLVNVTWYDSENTDGGPVPVITDTLGNIFTLVQSYYDENFGQGWATYYTINANGTSADTILAAYSSPSVSYTALLIDEFQGLFESTPLDDSASHYDVYESGNPSTRDLVVSTTCDLIYSLYGPTDPPSLPSAGDNFIVDGVYSNVWGNPEAYVGTEHRLVYSTGNVPVAWNIATTPAGSIVIGVAFKVADSGPPETSSDSLFGWI
jgi:hypothetical protein